MGGIEHEKKPKKEKKTTAGVAALLRIVQLSLHLFLFVRLWYVSDCISSGPPFHYASILLLLNSIFGPHQPRF